jgi:hypothetical protein
MEAGMQVLRIVITAIAVAGATGCASRQDVTRLEDARVQMICIVEHSAVQSGALAAIQDGLTKNGFRHRTLKGNYEYKHAGWYPSFSPPDAVACDAMLFYVANWNWDLAYYMYFANIWMRSADGTRTLAHATYDGSRNVGVGKFIVARDKLIELVDQMLVSVRNTSGQASHAVGKSAPAVVPEPRTDAANRLQQLEELRKRGLVSEDEYRSKRASILKEL